MLIKRVNHKRNYVLDINFKQCNDILIIKLKLHRVCPRGRAQGLGGHGNQSLKVVPKEVRDSRLTVRFPGLRCGPCVHVGVNVSHTLHDQRKSTLRGL